MSKPSVADQMLIDWRREVLHENRRLRAAVDKVRALCERTQDVREYGECGTPFYNGAQQLRHRIQRALDEALGDA